MASSRQEEEEEEDSQQATPFWLHATTTSDKDRKEKAALDHDDHNDDDNNSTLRAMSSGDDDDDDDDDHDRHAFRKRQRSRDEATYGIFLNDSDDDDDDNNDHDRHRRRHNKKKKKSSSWRHNITTNNNNASSSKSSGASSQSAPLFVRGATLKPQEDEDDEVKEEEDEWKTKMEETPIFHKAKTANATLTHPNNNNKDDNKDHRKSATATLGAAAAATEEEEEEEEETAASTKSRTAKVENDKDGKNNDDDDDEGKEQEEEKQKALQEQRDRANQYFATLLEKGRNPKRASASMSSAPLQRNGSDGGSAPPQTTMGLGASRSAGLGVAANHSGGGGGGLGFAAAGGSGEAASGWKRSSTATRPAKRDPTLGTWEKHTKGIGMKLLAKMGYTGSGGLGATKRRRRSLFAAGADGGAASANYDNDERGASSSSHPTAQTTTYHTDEAEVTPKGISRTMEVKVRPANLGLGFGGFKEATQLQVNRQIEAQVRGEKVTVPEATTTSSAADTRYNNGVADLTASMLPSVQQLLKEQSWVPRGDSEKETKTSRRGRRGKPKRTIVPYTELLAKTDASSRGAVVIDMRGPSTATKEGEEESDDADSDNKAVPLGEELLHNVTLLLSTHETQLYSAAAMEKSAQRKVASLQSDLERLHRQRQEATQKRAKLERALEILDQMEAAVGRGDYADQDSDVPKLVSQLASTFTPEERESLQFVTVLAPALLGQAVEARMATWCPWKESTQKSRELLQWVLALAAAVSVAEGEEKNVKSATTTALQTALFTKYVIPLVRQAFASTQWDPLENVDKGVALYATMLTVAKEVSPEERPAIKAIDRPNQVFPSSMEHDSDQHEPTLMDVVEDEILLRTIHPKLVRCLNLWKPQLRQSETGDVGWLENAVDRWILPWIPYLDRPGGGASLLSTLMADCKRKVRSAVSFLAKTVKNEDEGFVAAAMRVLRPWRGALKPSSLQDMVAHYVTPRLARRLAQLDMTRDATQQDWNLVDTLLELHDKDLLSTVEFYSLVEGELLPAWCLAVRTWICSVTTATASQEDLRDLAANYGAWKRRLLGDSANSRGKSAQRLGQDALICRYFYATLLLLQAASSTDGLLKLKSEHWLSPNPTSINYRTVLARRVAEGKRAAADDLVRLERSQAKEPGLVEARVRLQHSNSNSTPTFRQVVEEFARAQGVLFRPRLPGQGGATQMQGRPIFLFETIPVYLDGDVVYYQPSRAEKNGDLATSWQPVSLQSLVDILEKKTGG